MNFLTNFLFVWFLGLPRDGHEWNVYFAVALSSDEQQQQWRRQSTTRKCSIVVLFRGVELGKLPGLHDEFAIRFLRYERG